MGGSSSHAGHRRLGFAALTLVAWMVPSVAFAQSQTSAEQDATLAKSVLETIQAATFEVVAKKPIRDSLRYEKSLPLELLPYAIRTDKYLPLGTAFAIAPNRFVTAAHVLGLHKESLFTELSLRDRDGNVYPIDQIYKYSSRRDFVVLSAHGITARQALQVNEQPRLNEKVYAVGNAYGQGVVIRDGLYTSSTPEERDGAWKWIRFSAAASPGNSGGPLLDADGKVIGIVQAKSANENLNFALPMAEVLGAPDKLGVVDSQLGYRIDNMPMTKTTIFRHDIPLPKPIGELRRQLVAFSEDDGSRLMNEMFRENRDAIFPNGRQAANVLHNSRYSTFFPAVIAMGDDGNWGIYKSEKISKAEFDANGYLTTGELGNSLYFHLRLPENIKLHEIYSNSALLMDLFLKGVNYRRTVGHERIKIVSMGKAHDEHVHTDAYQRKWLVKSWFIEFNDQKLVMIALPTPDGLIGALRIVSAGQRDNHLRDMKALTDFTYVSYYATLSRWQEFLAIKDLLPATFADIRMHFGYGQEFRYESSRVALSYPAKLMKITPQSDLQLGFAFFRDGAKVVWDVGKIVMGEDKNSNAAYTVVRNIKPASHMGGDDQKNWEKIAHRAHPFDRTSYFTDNQTVIGTLLAMGDGKSTASMPVLYTLVHSRDGVIAQADALTRLEGFLHGVNVREVAPAGGARAAVKGSGE